MRRRKVDLADQRPSDVPECLLVMEAGSRRPSWLRSSTEVLIQPPEEPALDFALRATTAIRALGNQLRCVVLAAGSASGEEVFNARCRIARAAAASVALKAGSLLFAGHARLNTKVRHELFAIAGVLIEGMADTRVAVAVKFDGN